MREYCKELFLTLSSTGINRINIANKANTIFQHIRAAAAAFAQPGLLILRAKSIDIMIVNSGGVGHVNTVSPVTTLRKLYDLTAKVVRLSDHEHEPLFESKTVYPAGTSSREGKRFRRYL